MPTRKVTMWMMAGAAVTVFLGLTQLEVAPAMATALMTLATGTLQYFVRDAE